MGKPPNNWQQTVAGDFIIIKKIKNMSEKQMVIETILGFIALVSVIALVNLVLICFGG